jgi:hypothetical protein
MTGRSLPFVSLRRMRKLQPLELKSLELKSLELKSLELKPEEETRHSLPFS